MKTYHLSYTLDKIEPVALFIVKQLLRYRHITFEGPLGAGKTTLIKQIGKQLGIPEDAITSPTFAYVQIYQASQGFKVYHFDLYRVGTIDSFIELGFDEYLNDPNGICLIEWPEVIKPLLTSTWVKVMIDYDGIEKRKITITIPD